TSCNRAGMDCKCRNGRACGMGRHLAWNGARVARRGSELSRQASFLFSDWTVVETRKRGCCTADCGAGCCKDCRGGDDVGGDSSRYLAGGAKLCKGKRGHRGGLARCRSHVCDSTASVPVSSTSGCRSWQPRGVGACRRSRSVRE